jgi:ATP-grasp domain-containing protein
MPGAPRASRIAVLFPNRWDRRFLTPARFGGRYEFHFHGQDLWHFPGGLVRILAFDPETFLERTERELRRARVDAVVSTDEYLGTVLAAILARRLGLPGADPAAILRAQHKYYARAAQKKVAPAHVPDFQLVGLPPAADEIALPFPLFVKPVKGSFSMFAARVDSFAALRRHLDFNPLWRFAMRRVLAPFNQLFRSITHLPLDASRFLAETPLRGRQVALEGYVAKGSAHVLGIIDAHMYPGTNAFERFVYPSALPDAVQQRMKRLVGQIVAGAGIDHGPFNAELFYDDANDAISVIELHPRLSYQFADLYEDVDGTSTYELLLRLGLGETPLPNGRTGRYRQAASIALRTFRGDRVRRLPPRESIDAFRRRHPGARIEIFGREGSMQPEMRALGSYRYAVINLGVQCSEELTRARDDAAALLRCEIS